MDFFTRRAFEVSIAICLVVAFSFIIPTILRYSQTPTDPQKAIGYIFISAYGIIVGGIAGLGIWLLLQALGKWSIQAAILASLGFASLACL